MRILTSLGKFLPVLRKEFGLRFLTSPCPAGLARRRPRSGRVAAGVLRACVSEGAPWPLAATRLAGFLEERVTWSACLARLTLGGQTPPTRGRPHSRPCCAVPQTLLEGELPAASAHRGGRGRGSPGSPRHSRGDPVPPAWPSPARVGTEAGESSSRGLRGAGAEMPLPLTFFFGHIFPSQGQSMEQAREDHTRLLISPACLLPHLPLPFLLLSVFQTES